MESKSAQCHTFRGSVSILLLIFTWTQCSSESNLRECLATFRGFVSITFTYDTKYYEQQLSSWCLQVTRTECVNIVDMRGRITKSYEGRVTLVQVIGNSGSVTVNMTNLQIWDTGLYKWRIWIGTQYKVIQSVLLHVIEGIPSKLSVVRVPVHGYINMNCSFNKQQQWSKIWCKQMGHRKCDWVAHSDGSINKDYETRPVIYNDLKAHQMIMRITQLELWDSGLYKCKESGGETILEKILLHVTSNNIQSNEKNSILPSEVLTTTVPSHLGTNEATVSSRVKPIQSTAWDIIRWLLFLIMVVCLLSFICCKSVLDRCYIPIFHERLLRNKKFKSEVHF
ncbi:polymeric immunoglobulin receptor-like [Xenopus laevis]|uniref:Immunoglobulin V-set domain-containing protein n=1 Tax=Xenopus laevis TaxID=8355 RepID=A0A974DH03_XENLA|nr:polymeric immunoglobulin receptor-like [Xenopus laevis]OCT91844.1 hypothetical protein XELAEV_18014900mg [Xenopus laevis]